MAANATRMAQLQVLQVAQKTRRPDKKGGTLIAAALPSLPAYLYKPLTSNYINP